MKRKLLTMIGAIVLLPGLVQARGVAVVGKLGTLGVGAELAAALSPSITGRVGVNAFRYTGDTTQSGIDYHGELKLRSASVLADWYPTGSAFRATLGALYNRNEGDLNARPTGNQFVINGVAYPAADVGSLDGTVRFKRFAPYMGIGWGNPVAAGKGWGFTADLGVLYQGSPDVSLTAVCGSALSAAMCSQLQRDTAQERTQLASDVSRYKWYPVVSVGVSYRF